MSKKKSLMLALVFVMMHTIHTAETQNRSIIPGASYYLAVYEGDHLVHYSYYTADGTPIENVLSNPPYALLDPQAPPPKIVTCSFWRNPTPGQVKRDPSLAPRAGNIFFMNAQGQVVLSLVYNPLTCRLSGTTSHRYNQDVAIIFSNQTPLKDPTVGHQLGLDVSELDLTELNTDIAHWHRDYKASDHPGVRKHRGCVVS